MSLHQLRQRIVNALRKTTPAPLLQPGSVDEAEVAAMLRAIGIALIEVAQPTLLVEARLLEIARRYTDKPVRVVALPTVLLIQIGDVGYELEGSTHSSLQLDMAGRIDDIASLATAGAISPADAIEAIEEARSLRPRFGTAANIFGYAVTTVGFGLVINPTWSALPAYLFLGLVVGAIVQLTRPFPSLAPVLPVIAAMVVTVLAVWFVDATANDGLLRVISPALVATLPGMSLTIGAMELASTQIISGSSRLIYGMSQLALLVFGVAIGLHIAGYVPQESQAPLMGSWSLYVAIVVVSAGLYVYLSAPPGSFLWLMAAIGVVLLAQAAAGQVMSPSHPIRRGYRRGAVRDAGRADQDLATGHRDDAGSILVSGTRGAQLRGSGAGSQRRHRSRRDEPRSDWSRHPVDRLGHAGGLEHLQHHR